MPFLENACVYLRLFSALTISHVYIPPSPRDTSIGKNSHGIPCVICTTEKHLVKIIYIYMQLYVRFEASFQIVSPFLIILMLEYVSSSQTANRKCFFLNLAEAKALRQKHLYNVLDRGMHAVYYLFTGYYFAQSQGQSFVL